MTTSFLLNLILLIVIPAIFGGFIATGMMDRSFSQSFIALVALVLYIIVLDLTVKS